MTLIVSHFVRSRIASTLSPTFLLGTRSMSSSALAAAAAVAEAAPTNIGNAAAPTKESRFISTLAAAAKENGDEKTALTRDDDIQVEENRTETGTKKTWIAPEEFAKMSKAERKKIRRIQRRENEKDKKRNAKRERFIDPTATDNEPEITYVFENGLRKVKPYFYKYQTFVRGRWIGRTVLDVVSSEFRYDQHENYVTRLKQGFIHVNGSPVSADYVLRNHDSLSSRVHRHEIPVAGSPLTIVHEDDDFLVVNKPSTIPVHPCGRFRYNTVTMILVKEMGYKNVRTIHRLDRATSGILILVKNFAKTQEMAARVKNRDLRKEYVCRVMGEFPVSAAELPEEFQYVKEGVDVCNDDGGYSAFTSLSSSASSPSSSAASSTSAASSILVDAPLMCVSQKIGLNRVDVRGKESLTAFRRMSYNGTSSVVKCIPKTGRTHQIRVHLQYLGFPIMNDRFYNSPALWGARNGAAGDYDGKTDEQLLEDAARIHTVVNYLDADVYSELVRKHYGEKEEDDEENTGGDDKDVKDDESVVTTQPELENSAESEPRTERDSDFLSVVERHCQEDPLPDKDKISHAIGTRKTELETTPLSSIETENATVNSSSTQESQANSADGAAISSPAQDYDPTCKDCVQPTRDPNTQELVMFLHALRYSGPDFDFSTPLPEWAEEKWNEEERWKLF